MKILIGVVIGFLLFVFWAFSLGYVREITLAECEFYCNQKK